MMTRRIGMWAGGAATALALALSAPATAAAQDVEAGWLAYLGCWEAVDGTDDGLLCVHPTDDGVEMFTVLDGEVLTSDLLSGDGSQTARVAEGCDGWESAEFSEDRRRVFTRSEFVCGEEIPRTATGVLSLVDPTQLLDVRSVMIDGESLAWVRRYRLVGPERMAAAGVEDVTSAFDMSVRTVRMAAARPIDMEDVHEAVSKVDAKAVEAWVAARGDRFALDAEELIRVADSGVPESVIDVIVAVSYPEHFSIDAAAAEARAIRGGGGGGVGPAWGMGDPSCRSGYMGMGRSLAWNPFFYGYGASSCFRANYRSAYGYGGYGYNSRYAPGYGYAGGYYGGAGYGYGGYYPTTVVIDRSSPAQTGRAVNGRGYTRGSSGSSGSAGPARAGGGSSRTGASGAAPSRGASQPASSGTTGRKAKPRGGR